MARTIQQIYDSLLACKNAVSDLNGLTATGTANYANTISQLNSGSRVAIWRLWLYIVAVHTWTLENYFDLHKQEVKGTVASGFTCTPPWMAAAAKRFQYGDAVTVDANYVAGYALIDTSKQIVKYSAAIEGGGITTLKVAKDVSGVKSPLSSAEFAAFQTYIDRIKSGGMAVTCVSLAGDTLKLNVEVYYDGLYNQNTVLSDVKNSIKTYLANLSYDGLVYVEKLEDSIQSVAGVKDSGDVKLLSATGVSGTENKIFYLLGANGFNNRYYECASGYISLDEANSTFTMIAI